ncbi:MAG TPA: response regulator [Bryobacteraceae bacterium]|nr:response regulator [Bryobacteraceae bacterium]
MSITILVVDDEAEVRKLVGAVVAQSGYTVLTADSGDHAMAVYRNYHKPIDLLITDVIAPGMSGPMLADKLTALQPDLRVLYISGYDNTQVVRKYVVEKGHELLSKPFTTEALRLKVAEILNRPARSQTST